MRQRSFKLFLGLAWCFLLHTTAHAQVYNHTVGGATDIAVNGGDANALVVQIVNLSPYNIVFNTDPSFTNLKDVYGPLGSPEMTRTTAKSFEFAPLGVPQFIPPPPPQAFIAKTDPRYDPAWKNTVTRPGTFVLAWNDHDGVIGSNTNNPPDVTFTIKGVPCVHDDRCPSVTQNVDLGLFVTRDVPAAKVMTAGDYAKLVTGALSSALSVVGVVVDPASALGWVGFFLTLSDLGQKTPDQIAAFDERQTCDKSQGFLLGCDTDRHGQWWISAYTLPDQYIKGVANPCYFKTSNTLADPSACSPAAYKASDAVEAHWDELNGGWFTKSIVVTTHVLRGKQATPSYGGVSGCMYPYTQYGSKGWAPVVMVTVWTEDQWLAANTVSLSPVAGAAPPPDQKLKGGVAIGPDLIRALVQQYGREAILELLSMIQDLPQVQRDYLRDLIKSHLAGKPLTQQQEAFVHMIAVRLRARLQ